jgi:hypothetical protein
LAQAPLAVRYWTATRHSVVVVGVVVVVAVAVALVDVVVLVLVVVVAVAVDVEEVAESVVSVAVESVLE